MWICLLYFRIILPKQLIFSKQPLPQVARTLLAAGADPDLPDKTSGQTPLHYAALYGYTGVMEDLLSKCCGLLFVLAA